MARQDTDQEVIRLRFMLFGMICVMAFVLFHIHRLQVVKRTEYAQNVAAQSIRHVRVPGWRGRMFDRNGLCFADNRPSHCIAIFPSEPGVRQRGSFGSTINKVDEIVGYLKAAATE